MNAISIALVFTIDTDVSESGFFGLQVGDVFLMEPRCLAPSMLL